MPKTILITGAARGIGFAAAGQLIACGCEVIITSRDAARAEAASEKLGPACHWLALDATDPASLRAAAADFAARFGNLDVLVNNGAILLDWDASPLDLDPEVLRATLETNVTGALRATQAFLPLLQKSAAPRIINVSSGAGQFSEPPHGWAPAYSISKAALNMLTLQLDAALPGCAVNAMSPGWCRTDMGCENAPLSAEEGAETLVWLALDAPPDLSGRFIRDRQAAGW